MEFLKKFGFWIAVGVLLLGAAAFYFLMVETQAAAYVAKVEALDKLSQSIKAQDKGSGTPNERFTKEEARYEKALDKEISKVQKIVVAQRRNCHTQLFWVPGDPRRAPVDTRAGWAQLYAKETSALSAQLRDSGLGGGGLSFRNYAKPGTSIPTWREIRNDQVHYWLCKDIVDLLTNQAERDVEEELRDAGEPSLKTLFDLVRTADPGELANKLQAFGKKRLAAVLAMILVNSAQEDMKQILERDRPIYLTVRQLTVGKAQERFLKDLASRFKERNDLVGFVEDLRWVRYREDLVGLFRNKGFPDLAADLRNWGPAVKRRVVAAIHGPGWRPLKLAKAIDAAVSITDEKDLSVILANHRLQIAHIDSLKMPRTTPFPEGRAVSGGGDRRVGDGMEEDGGTARGAAGGGGRSRGQPGVYNAFPVDMTVTIEFRHIPVLIRRLLTSDWRIEIDNISITRVGRLAASKEGGGKAGPGEEEPGGGEPKPKPAAAPGAPKAAAGVPAAKGAAAKEPEKEKTAEAFRPGNYVKVTLECEARQLYPLWQKIDPETVKKLEDRFIGR